MSNDYDKEKHGERVAQKEKKLKRKIKIAKAYKQDHVLKEPHKYANRSIFSCANSQCAMCGNPRKIFDLKTMQEQSAEQNKLYDE